MRHVALKVKNVAQSKTFTKKSSAWTWSGEPDAENVYLSSGCDNIAIHAVSANFAASAEEKQLDHLGFIVESTERVKELEREFIAKGCASFTRSKRTATAARRFTARTPTAS